MKRIALSAAALSVLMLAACATTGAPSPAQDAGLRTSQVPEPVEGRSGYGLYLAGRAALADGRSDMAAKYFERAALAGAESATLKERTFQSALFAGDIPAAAAAAPADGEGSIILVRLGQLTRGVEAIASGDGAAAKAILVDQGVGFPHRPAATLLAPWAAAAAGDMEAATVRPVLRGDRLVEVFGLHGQALLLERAKRYDEAEANYKQLMALGDAAIIFAPDYGAFLERRRRGKEAVEVYDKALAVAPNDVTLKQARERAASRRKAPAMMSVREGSARALLIPAASLAAEKQYGLALAYTRLALRLDPARDDSWVLLGDIFSGMEDSENAREAYARIRPGSASYATARSKLAWTLQTSGDTAAALTMAEDAVRASPEDRDALVTYADILRANERYAESAKVLDKVVAADGAGVDWRILFMRAVARDRSGDWPGAEADLLLALQRQPDEPDLLNYLGYSWIDRGVRLGEALPMVQKAVAANPRNGAMIDSLGWAYFRMGDYRNAVEHLERAVLLEPADPEINDHLGDAYWQVGRQIEARFQWTRVLQLDAPQDIRVRAEDKLKNGLTGVKPVVAERP